MTHIPTGYKKNAQDHLVPMSQIKPIDLLRDDVVIKAVEEAKSEQARLAVFKACKMVEVSDFLDLSAEEYGVNYGGAKGNVTLMSYDGRFKLVRTNPEHRIFDERIQAAKAQIDACIARWSEGANEHIKALIEHAFRVNKQGFIDVNQVLSLRQLDIHDEDWLAAMAAIADSIKITGSKPYIRFYERQEDDSFKNIHLDLSKL